MDLKLVPHAEPTASERARARPRPRAADVGLGGRRPRDGRRRQHAGGGHAARARRHLLLPALWALQERIGWISPGGLNELCRRLTVPPADAYGVATFYALFALEPRPPRVVHVCEDVACRCHGSRGAHRAARGALRRRGRALRRRLGDVVPEPLPRPVRPRTGGAGRDRRRRAARPGAGADDRRRRARAPRGRRARARARRRGCRRRATRRSASCDASASSTRRASTTTARTAATRRCAARSSSGPRASSAR